MNFKILVYGQCFSQLRGKPCHIYQTLCCFLQSMPWSNAGLMFKIVSDMSYFITILSYLAIMWIPLEN
jgi:hypothetical protein